MHFPFTVEPAIFLERPNRYVVHARLCQNDEIVRAHCPDPGRLEELLIPGTIIHVDRAADPNRRTSHTLRFVEHPASGQLVSLNTHLPNALFVEGWQTGFFPQFQPYTELQREVRLQHGTTQSRIDFCLRDDAGNECWVETKSASLVLDGVARFPDAPTIRGRRHVEALMHQVEDGHAAAIIFVVQRPDAHTFAPYWERDPDLGDALRQAQRHGVSIYAYTCELTPEAIWLAQQIPVHLERSDASRYGKMAGGN